MKSQVIYESIEEYLKEQISKYEQSIDRKKEILKDGNVFERIRAKGDISDLHEKNRDLGKFEQELSKFRHNISSSDYRLPSELKDQLEILASKLGDEERGSLEIKVNSSLRNENYFKKVSTINEQAANLEKSAEKIFKSGLLIHVHNLSTSYGSFSIKKLIDDLKKDKIEELDFDSYTVSFNKEEQSEIFDSKMDRIDFMIKSVDVFDNKDMNRIKANYQNIRENQIDKIKSEQILSSLEVVIPAVEREMQTSGIDFKRVIDGLQEIKKNANKKLSEANAYLSKFNLEVIDKELENFQEKTNDQEHRDEYMQLVYDREKALAEGNLVKAEEIRKRMVAAGEKYDNNELISMQQEMKNKLSRDRLDEQIIKEEKAKEDEIKTNRTVEEIIMYEDGRQEQEIQERKKIIEERKQHLRDLAKERLAYEGVQFDEEKDEFLIQAEVEKMKRIAQMTPQERAKEDGVENPNDFVFYGDEFMGFDVKDFKSTEKDFANNMNSQATSIYKEYIKYMAKQPDKNAAMKFSEFAAVQYGHLGMSEQMVDEEVLSEGRTR